MPLAGDRKQFSGREYDLDHVLSFLCEGRHPLGNLSNLSQFHLLLSLHKHHHINEPVHEISNNLVCATSKASDQPAHTRSLIRAFANRLSIL